jgi:transketolase N-terminal domain/subunit
VWGRVLPKEGYNMKNIVKQLIEYSYANNLSHIPSALSMLSYLEELFEKKLVTKEDFIVIGKPFGSQAYYLLWEKYWGLKIEGLSAGVKHDEIDFVDYSEETIGNALGVGCGIAMTTDKLVWVNITDATLQMGNTLEAIQFIGQMQLKNIALTIDYNNSQVLGSTSDIIDVDPVIQMFKAYNWHVEHDLSNFGMTVRPRVYVLKTTKGDGIPVMEDNIKEWHYKVLNEKDFKQIY